MNPLAIMFWAYITFALSLLVGYMFPNHRTAAIIKITFSLLLAVLLAIIIWGVGTMAFLYFSSTEVNFK